MAKQSKIQHNLYRMELVKKFAPKREALKAIMRNPESTDEEFYAAQRKLSKLPRNSSPIRVRNRCSVTGRPRAFFRKFGLSRLTLRELANEGKLPGVTKSSW
jgi:small subunit ribosomal protein S14